MKINLTIEISDPVVEIDNYSSADKPINTVRDAVQYDLDMFSSGEVSLEDVIYNFGGDVVVKVSSIEGDESNQEVHQ